MANVMFYWLFFLSLPLRFTRPCLQCDRLVQHLHEDFLSASTAATVKDQIELKKIIDHAYVTYEETSQHFHGVTDPTTLYRARTEYQSEFHKFLGSLVKESLLFDTIQMMEKGRKILQKHLETFVRTGLCPNRCGLLYQKVINCHTCVYEVRTCSSPADQRSCGDHQLEAVEGSQVVLDCCLPWHHLVVGPKEYQYSWSSDLSGEFKVFLVTPQSKAVLNQLNLDEQGIYRCLLLDSNSTVLSSIQYQLTVKGFPPTPAVPVKTVPTLPPHASWPHMIHRDFIVAGVAALTAVGLVASLGVAVAFGIALKRQQRRVARQKRRGEERTALKE